MAFWKKYETQHALLNLTGHCQIVSQGEGCIVVGGLQVGEVTVANPIKVLERKFFNFLIGVVLSSVLCCTSQKEDAVVLEVVGRPDKLHVVEPRVVPHDHAPVKN